MRHFATALVIAVVLVASLPLLASANPPDIPQGWHKVYQFNLIGHPGEYSGGCGEGNRVFVERDARNATMLVVNGGSWDITDCNATGHNTAEMTTRDAARYAVFVKMLGKPGGNLRICADYYSDYVAGEDMCLLGYLDLTRGRHSRFTLAPSSMFDASLEDIIWQIDTNQDFRIAQFRVYEIPEN